MPSLLVSHQKAEKQKSLRPCRPNLEPTMRPKPLLEPEPQKELQKRPVKLEQSKLPLKTE